MILCKPLACSNTIHHKTNDKHHNYNTYKYWNQIKYYSSHLINNTHSHLQKMKNTPNMNHLITPCKPLTCSNTTTTINPISNITSIEFYKCLNQIKYYSSYLINNTRSHLQEMKNTPNISLNHFITPCKLPTCSNTTTHHKTNHKHHNYNAYKYWNQIKYYSSY